MRAKVRLLRALTVPNVASKQEWDGDFDPATGILWILKKSYGIHIGTLAVITDLDQKDELQAERMRAAHAAEAAQQEQHAKELKRAAAKLEEEAKAKQEKAKQSRHMAEATKA